MDFVDMDRERYQDTFMDDCNSMGDTCSKGYMDSFLGSSYRDNRSLRDGRGQAFDINCY